MEISAYARTVLLGEDLEQKLAACTEPVTDDAPGEPLRVEHPARPAGLEFAAPRTAPAMPKPQALRDPAKRAVAHHIMANHELQALEVMAAVLLAFPEAPAGFRRGMVHVMQDERRHTRMHMEQAARLGVQFGDLPVNGYIWARTSSFRDPLDYLVSLPLVFENCNLDHTLELEVVFLQAGDSRSAGVMRAIHRDEIEHVRFGVRWLQLMKPPGMEDHEAWLARLQWPLQVHKARGHSFDAESRREAGLSEDWIACLAEADPIAAKAKAARQPASRAEEDPPSASHSPSSETDNT